MSMAIATAPQQKVVVHPIVLLSVVDHYNRVAKDTKFRVVGCLLGDASKDQVPLLYPALLSFWQLNRMRR